MSTQTPKPRGYDDRENCSNCHKDEFSEGDIYEDEDGTTVQDIYCDNCGVIVEIVELDEEVQDDEDKEQEEELEDQEEETQENEEEESEEDEE